MAIVVRVPATSANLGPGFDTAGIALTLYNTFTFELIDEGLEFINCPKNYANEHNLVYTSFKKAAKQIGLSFQGLRITSDINVPYTRGLGSSSTCIVAGIVGAFGFMGKADDKKAILKLANEIEGHPDNVAPAIYGGLCVSAMTNEVTTLNIPMAKDYQFVALIPPFSLSTKKSRSVLPQTITKKDAVENLSHLALLLASFVNGFDDGLKYGFLDNIHQPYRGSLIQGYDHIMERLSQDQRILGSYLSGAGPTIMVVLSVDEKKEEIEKMLFDLIKGWKVLSLKIDKKGYIYENRD